MLIATIQNAELPGVISLIAEKIEYVPSNEVSVGIRIKFNTVENNLRFVEAMYNQDPFKNPIIDTGDDWVLLDVAYLSKVELKGALK